MKTKIIVLLAIIAIIIGCNNKPSLEQYFVTNTENKNFVQVDIAPSILNVDQTKLTDVQKTALKSFDKMNVLVFKINEQNKSLFASEKNKVKEILKDQKYQQLMKFGSGQNGASVSYVGSDEHISEFIISANSEAGFGIVRVLGKDMNPNAILDFISVLKDSDIKLDQLKPLQDLMN